MLRMRSMGSRPCKQPGLPIVRLRSSPSGGGLCGRSAALRCLKIAGLLAAHRALPPILQRPLRGTWEMVNGIGANFHDAGRRPGWCKKPEGGGQGQGRCRENSLGTTVLIANFHDPSEAPWMMEETRGCAGQHG